MPFWVWSTVHPGRVPGRMTPGMVTGWPGCGGRGLVVDAVVGAPEAATDARPVGVVGVIAALGPQPLSVISPAVIGAMKAWCMGFVLLVLIGCEWSALFLSLLRSGCGERVHSAIFGESIPCGLRGCPLVDR